MLEKRITVWVQRFKDRPHLVLQWIDPETGKRKSRGAGTADPDKADKARQDLEYELNNGLYEEASRMTWEKFRELFEEEHVASKRPDTRTNYASTLDLFEKLCNPRSLRGINVRTISRFAAGMRTTPGRAKGSKGFMPSTIKVRLQFLHKALSWAAKQKLLTEVPEFPSVKVPKKVPQPVPAEAFEKLLAKAEGDCQMQAFLLCGWLGGLRLAEAWALEWEETTEAPWINLADHRIILPAELVKGDADQWVPLDPVLREVLLELPRQGPRVFRFISTKSGSKGSILGDGGVSQRVIDLAHKAGVRLTMKSLRRGFGCRLAGKVPAQVLQKLMRHASIKTTMAYYANVDDAAMEAILGPQRNSLRNKDTSEAEFDIESVDASPYEDSANSPSASERPSR
jgi:integrase